MSSRRAPWATPRKDCLSGLRSARRRRPARRARVDADVEMDGLAVEDAVGPAGAHAARCGAGALGALGGDRGVAGVTLRQRAQPQARARGKDDGLAHRGRHGDAGSRGLARRTQHQSRGAGDAVGAEGRRERRGLPQADGGRRGDAGDGQCRQRGQRRGASPGAVKRGVRCVRVHEAHPPSAAIRGASAKRPDCRPRGEIGPFGRCGARAGSESITRTPEEREHSSCPSTSPNHGRTTPPRTRATAAGPDGAASGRVPDRAGAVRRGQARRRHGAARWSGVRRGPRGADEGAPGDARPPHPHPGGAGGVSRDRAGVYALTALGETLASGTRDRSAIWP